MLKYRFKERKRLTDTYLCKYITIIMNKTLKRRLSFDPKEGNLLNIRKWHNYVRLTVR